MSRIIIISTVFVVIGLVIGLNLQQSETKLAPMTTSHLSDDTLQKLIDSNRNLQARMTSIETQLNEEHSNQLSLGLEIASLKKQLKTNSQLPLVNTPLETTIAETTPASPPSTESFNINKESVLLSLGVDENITARIKQREEKLEMDRLYLRNTAAREGWFGTERYFEETQRIAASTNVYREELGDENYDRYLFDSNQSNRISVLSVISSSPAETAGIKKGDIISQYGEEAVFSWSDLTKATTNGEAGQQVSIVIQRNNEEIEFFVPRGPLGIRLENIKVNPNS